MNTQSPMKMKYYCYKVEFAIRGAAHIHGVLWVDLSNFDFLTKNLKKKKYASSKSNDEEEETVTLQSLFDKIRNEENLTPDEIQALCKFADLFVTCSLKDVRTEDVVRDVQIHHHTKCCRKSGHKCRFYFPKFPSIKTMISVPIHQLNLTEEERKQMVEQSNAILNECV